MKINSTKSLNSSINKWAKLKIVEFECSVLNQISNIKHLFLWFHFLEFNKCSISNEMSWHCTRDNLANLILNFYILLRLLSSISFNFNCIFTKFYVWLCLLFVNYRRNIDWLPIFLIIFFILLLIKCITSRNIEFFANIKRFKYFSAKYWSWMNSSF